MSVKIILGAGLFISACLLFVLIFITGKVTDNDA